MATKKSTEKPNIHGFGERGLALFKQYDDHFDLDASSEEILVAACRCADLINTLDHITLDRGPVDADGKVAGFVTECRFQKGILLKLTAQLERLAQPLDGGSGSQRNLGGARAPYAQRKG